MAGTSLDTAGVQHLLDSLQPLAEVVDKAEALLRRKLGKGFYYANYTIRYPGRSRGSEVPLNRILCDLLDPHGSHGQGTLFLGLFLETVDKHLAGYNLDEWIVKPSFPTTGRRFIDIVLSCGDRAAIGVECKPWGDESQHQLEDYAKHLLDHCKYEKVWLLFLPGYAREPSSLTEQTRIRLGERFIIIPFQRNGLPAASMVGWLENCAARCEAEKVRWFLRDLAEYLDAEFPLSRSDEMADNPGIIAIAGIIAKDVERLKIAFDVESVMPIVRRHIATEFMKGIAENLRDRGWIPENKFNQFSRGGTVEYLMSRHADWPPYWGICLQMGADNMRGFDIGFYCGDNEPLLEEREEIRSVLRSTLSDIQKYMIDDEMYPNWPAWSPLPKPFANWLESDVFALMQGLQNWKDGRPARETFVDWFCKLGEAAEPVVKNMKGKMAANAPKPSSRTSPARPHI